MYELWHNYNQSLLRRTNDNSVCLFCAISLNWSLCICICGLYSISISFKASIYNVGKWSKTIDALHRFLSNQTVSRIKMSHPQILFAINYVNICAVTKAKVQKTLSGSKNY